MSNRIAPIALCFLLLVGCAEGQGLREPGVLVISKEQQATWVRNFNPMLTTGGARFPTRGGIYEPLAVYNSVSGEYEPWLATAWEWEPDHLALRVTLREGVTWSDGSPLTADDVQYTFHLIRDHPALDGSGLWLWLDAVEVPSDHALRFVLKRPYVPGFHDLAHTPIVPRHVWELVDDPVRFSNPDPVASGPFTEVLRFDTQIWELGRNKDHWGGPPAVEVLRFPAFPSNEQATLALLQGEVDWAGNFVPAIDRIYVARDPEHHHYWFPPLSGTVFLYANTHRVPLGDRGVRQALSMAIDRELLVKVALYDYTRPADATGMSDLLAPWRDEEAVREGAWWVSYDVTRAEQMLDQAGYVRASDGWRYGPDGSPLVLTVMGVAGWSDWVRACQVIVRNLEQIGVQASLKSYDFSAWFDRVQRGDYDLAIGWSGERPTPYGLYRGLMSEQTVRPLGERAPRNWHRYASPAIEPLLRAFEQSSDAAERHTLGAQMQRLFALEAPAIPLYPAPAWGEFSTERFTGFPSADDPYARLSPNLEPESLLVLTRLRPVSP